MSIKDVVVGPSQLLIILLQLFIRPSLHNDFDKHGLAGEGLAFVILSC